MPYILLLQNLEKFVGLPVVVEGPAKMVSLRCLLLFLGNVIGKAHNLLNKDDRLFIQPVTGQIFIALDQRPSQPLIVIKHYERMPSSSANNSKYIEPKGERTADKWPRPARSCYISGSREN